MTFVDFDPKELSSAIAVAPSDRHLELEELVAAALDQLPDALRIPVVLRDLDGLTYEEISTELGIGLSAVKMRIKRGREQLRVRITELAPDMVTEISEGR